VRGYGWNEKENLIENRDSIRPLAAFSSGGFLTNVLDLARWEAAFHGEKLLKRSTLEQMWTPVRLKDGRPGPYGLGFQLDDVQGIPARGHAGGTPGFNGDLRTFGNGSLTIIILANQRNVSELDTLRGEIGGSYLPELLPLHDREPRRDPDPERTRLLRTVLTDWAAEDKDSPRIVPGLQALHSSAMSAMTRGRLEKIEAFEFLGERETGDAVIERLGSRVRRIVLYRMRSGGEWFYYTFYLTEDGRVAYFQSSTR
jgi:hypothetical protein